MKISKLKMMTPPAMFALTAATAFALTTSTTLDAYAFTADVVLRPGAPPIRMTPNESVTIACEAVGSQKPVCALKNLSGSYHVQVGADPFAVKSTFEEGLKVVKTLRENGLCQ